MYLVVTDGHFFLEVFDEFDAELRHLVASQNIRDKVSFNAYLNHLERTT